MPPASFAGRGGVDLRSHFCTPRTVMNSKISIFIPATAMMDILIQNAVFTKYWVAWLTNMSKPATAATRRLPRARQNFLREFNDRALGRSSPTSTINDRDGPDHERNRNDMNHLNGCEHPCLVMDEYRQRRGLEPFHELGRGPAR